MLGVGIDIIEVSRIKHLIKSKGDKFLNRIFSKKEISYCSSKINKYERFSGRYAAKEAVKKALPYNENVLFKEIEILNNGDGSPYVQIKKPIYNHIKMHISISHISEFATSIAVIEN